MKSPSELASKLSRQWHLADNREQRFLLAEMWPLQLGIGKPSAIVFTRHTDRVREHVQRWRAVTVGKVVWEPVSYRSGSEPVVLPVRWDLCSVSEWVAAMGDRAIEQEYCRLERLCAATDPRFHSVLLRQRYLLHNRPDSEIVQATRVALALVPGCANGRPLRALGTEGIDSKFFERHRSLMTQLLDVVFDGRISDLGLEPFLGALEENDHWLLVSPLEQGLLPFAQQRVRVSELINTHLRAPRILLVENESCLYQLPTMVDTIAVLGAGLNLGWLQTEALDGKRIAYWGDMDTWGLAMLAKARRLRPDIQALLMQREVFEVYQQNAVPEPYNAGIETPSGLTDEEAHFYAYLLSLERGRLEQEFLSVQAVSKALNDWEEQCKK